MAAIPVTIVGIDQSGNPTTIVGMMSYTGLGVGGGPVQPPVGIWPPGPGIDHPAHPIAPGGGGPHPEHPIVLPPYEPGGPPVEIWPSPGHPAHPIVLPPPPAPPSEGVKPPPPDGGWGYHPDYGWGYFPGPGEAGPKT